MWKRLAVLVVVVLFPVSALAHTKLFYRRSYRSDYRKVEVMIPTPTPTEVPTSAPTVEIMNPEEPTDQIATTSDIAAL